MSRCAHPSRRDPFLTSQPTRRMAPAERELWTGFLAELGYATADEELMVNELLAYMATETRLFGGPGPAGGRDRRRGPGGGKGGPGGDRHAELRAPQKRFVAEVKAAVPAPYPSIDGHALALEG